ncbi:FliA/WhiG family RNA polymerase sigma factor [Bacillus carboniphilus]|uniref:RNA polymerase sigma factor n=1 Tax=Bacillus carboniphilus TaxID=86663 RepID=A0ABY9JYU5_9BACI|nr:FliA/WhiG family RNA polymerase sigma factor [Bacillus carboniphilus]WLR43518.1 FliA/WhiG family RNA polymerase sigma factor [Bacillus carboniphilus]
MNTLEDQQYWDSWVNAKDANAADMLIRKYIPLVSYHVNRIASGLPKSVDKEDLMSLGMVGLYDALEKFDLSRDLKFDTYASFRIRGAILDGLRKEDWLPRSAREKAKRIETTFEQLEQKLLRKVTNKEVANELNITEDEVKTIVREGYYANILSIDEKMVDHEDGDQMVFVIKDQKMATPEEQLLKQELVEQLVEKIEELSENEQLVISLCYKEELTLTEIGKVLGLSTSRISQIHTKAINKLKYLLV